MYFRHLRINFEIFFLEFLESEFKKLAAVFQIHSVYLDSHKFTDVDTMGMLWSLEPAPGQPQNTRMAINFTNRPGLIAFKVYNGHLNLQDIYMSNTQNKIQYAQEDTKLHTQPETQNSPQNIKEFTHLMQQHIQHTELDSLVSTKVVERWYKHKDVIRIEIEEGNVRGALFLPPGKKYEILIAKGSSIHQQSVSKVTI